MFSNVNSIEKFEKVKLPQIETISRFYQPRKNRKAIRILTVAIYVLCVSLAAIMLSLYYVFIWDPTLKTSMAKLKNCEKIIISEQIAIRLLNSTEITADKFYSSILQHYQIQQRQKYHQRIIRVRNNNNHIYQNQLQKHNHDEPHINLKSKIIKNPSKRMTTSIRKSTTTKSPNILRNLKKSTTVFLDRQLVDDEDDYVEDVSESSGFNEFNKQ